MVNPDKTDVLWCSTSQPPPDTPLISWHYTVQPPVSVRNLCVPFDADLSLIAHVNQYQLTARCYRSLRRINSYRRATPEQLPQEHINKAAANFTKRLTACVAAIAIGGHFEHLQ